MIITENENNLNKSKGDINMTLLECSKVLNCKEEEITIEDLEWLLSAGYEPVEGRFNIDMELYTYIPYTTATEDYEGSVDIEGYIRCVYSIQDENGCFCDKKSVIKCDSQYFYFPHKTIHECIHYSRFSRVGEAIKKLRLHNEYGRLNHTFNIVLVRVEDGVVIC
jgi:hypothetical protein